MISELFSELLDGLPYMIFLFITFFLICTIFAVFSPFIFRLWDYLADRADDTIYEWELRKKRKKNKDEEGE